MVELASYSASTRTTLLIGPWALWNDVMVKGGISMDTPMLASTPQAKLNGGGSGVEGSSETS